MHVSAAIDSHLRARIENGEEIHFENSRFSNFPGLVTLTLDWVIQYTLCITRRPLPTYQISGESGKNFCGQMDARTYKLLSEST